MTKTMIIGYIESYNLELDQNFLGSATYVDFATQDNLLCVFNYSILSVIPTQYPLMSMSFVILSQYLWLLLICIKSMVL